MRGMWHGKLHVECVANAVDSLRVLKRRRLMSLEQCNCGSNTTPTLSAYLTALRFHEIHSQLIAINIVVLQVCKTTLENFQSLEDNAIQCFETVE